MAYTTPVVALIVNTADAEAALGLEAGYFEDMDNYDRDKKVEELAKLTGAPLESFSDEEGEMFYFGIEIDTDFYITLDNKFLQRVAEKQEKYTHPIIQNAELAVVSQFH